jgi:hypothetical protein
MARDDTRAPPWATARADLLRDKAGGLVRVQAIMSPVSICSGRVTCAPDRPMCRWSRCDGAKDLLSFRRR